MEIEGFAFQLLLRVMMRKGMSWIGVYKDQTVGLGREMNGGGRPGNEDPGQQPSKDVVLDHIILDLTGKSVPLDQIADASTQRAFKRKKRLLRHSNTVLISRLGIMALAAIMLMVTTLLTWYFTSTYSARSIRSLANDLRQQLMSNSMQAMMSVLGEVYNATFVLSSLQQQVYHGTSNHSWDSVEVELRRVNRGVFNAQHQYTSVAFVSEDGRVTDFTRSKTCEYFFFVNTTYAEAETPVWYWQNFTGYSDESLAPPPTHAPGPYPLSAANLLSKRPLEVYWTIAANLWDEAVVSPAVPARDMTTDNLLGMATITSTFTYLNSYLATIDLLGGILYFQWHNDTQGSSLVAFSWNSTNDTLLSPLNASNPTVRAAALFLQSTYGNTVMSVDETHSANIGLEGQDYYIDTVPLSQSPYNALNLTAVMIVPRKSIMGRVDQRNHTVVRVSIGTAIGVLVLGCCFICFITSKMSTEMQLRQELIRLLLGKHRAEQSSNYKSQFLANMSHELRTPIAAIIGLLDVLSSDALTTDQEINVSQIRNCATGLLALVNNVLDITKVEVGSMDLEVAPFSVEEELEALVEMFAVQSVGSNIDVVLDLSDDIPPVVRGDAPRIRQIFKNLLSNSVKFTNKGHVLVRGWVDQSLLFKQNGKQTDFKRSMSGMLSRRERVSGPLMMGIENQVALVFEVRDTGCGIPVELYESVFDSFVQADSSTTRTYGGSGLGLYVVRSLVELMGGEVAVVPTEGPGTLMRFHVIVERADNTSFIGGRVSCGDVYNQSFGSSSTPDWLNSGLESPTPHPLEPERPPSPPEVPHEKPQVLVAMLEGVAQNVAVQWLEKDGLNAISVKIWDDIIPVLEDLLKRNNAKELRSPETGGQDISGVGIDSGSSQNLVNNTESSPSSVFDTPSVLALVDVTMHPSTKIGFDSIFVEPTVLGLSDMISNGPDPQRLPPHMQDILDCMLRIHSQNPVAVGWIVGPDCGLGWRQALEAGGRFSVMKKPLSGNRMRQLVAVLTSTGKLEQHPWEDVQSSSSATSTPSIRSMPILGSHEGNFVSHTKQCREQSEPNVGVLRNRSPVNTAPSSAHHMSEKRIEDTDSPASFLNGQRHSQETSSDRESNDEVFSSEASLPELPQSFRNVGVDDRDSRFVEAHSSGVKPCAKSPSNGLQRHGRVFLLDMPYDTDESQMPFGLSNNPLSPTNGLVAPKAAANGLMIKPEKGNPLTANDVQEMQSIRMDGRDLENGAMDLRFLNKAQENHSETSDGLSIYVENRDTSREQTSATSPVVITPHGQLPVLSETKTSTQFSHKNHMASIPDTSGSAASNSVMAFKNRALSSMNILLVEDTPVLQRLASIMLRKLGANVTVVGDGQQAVTAVSETVKATEHIDAPYVGSVSNFDLILMDCAMPVMDGYNATLAIRAAEENTCRHVPIVALTAHALVSDEERCLSVGMDAYLTKPINCQLMVTTIQDLVSKQRAS